MNYALIALELQAILNRKSLLLAPTETEALQHAIVHYRHRAKLQEARK